MKRIAALLLTFFLTTCFLTAQEPFFCVTPGTVQYYERCRLKTGKLTQTTLFEIKTVEKKKDGRRAKYFVTMKDHWGKDIFGGRTALAVDIDAISDTHMNFGEFIKCFAQNILGDIKITSKGNAALLPSGMRPGDILPDAHCEVSWGILSLVIDVIDRKVLRCETITTPAGTFECVVAREHKIENGPFHYGDEWSDTWYARGVGYVRHDTLNKKMEPIESEILIRRELK
ncbi:MAG: hypothetical protein IJR25_07905 [Bacteroidales bacterium]|nr:hypothetical protein [Bacteroidales bacterium]